MRELRITPIRNGTVIDHIGSGLALDVLEVLGIPERQPDASVSVAMHVRSGKLGWKDIVKVENVELSARNANAIALIAPTATISIIREFKVREKRAVDLPARIVGVLTCPNPNCISNQGEPLESEFEVAERRPTVLQCAFCERRVDDFRRHLA